MPDGKPQKRPNLYYILLEDQKAHFMPPKRAEAIRQALFGNTDPPKPSKPPP